jgi:hypothetical protein
MVKKSRKRFSILLAILALLTFTAGYLVYAAMWGTNNKQITSNSPSEVMDKIKNAQTKVGVLELVEEDINAVTKKYVDKGITKGDITVKDMYTEISEGKIKSYALVEYKNMEVLLSSVGTVTYENNKVIYKPEGFKLGKLSLPKSIIMDKIQEFSSEDIKVLDDRIEVDKEIFPFDIESLNIRDDKIVAQIKKINTSMIFSPISVGDNGSQKQPTNKQQSIQSNDNNSSKVTNDKAASPSKPVVNQEVEKRRTLLKKISSQLSAARGDVGGAKERAVISTAISAVNQMAQNPSGGIITGGLQSQYGKLTPEEKSRVKTAIFNNVDMRAASELANLFGM